MSAEQTTRNRAPILNAWIDSNNAALRAWAMSSNRPRPRADAYAAFDDLPHWTTTKEARALEIAPVAVQRLREYCDEEVPTSKMQAFDGLTPAEVVARWPEMAGVMKL